MNYAECRGLTALSLVPTSLWKFSNDISLNRVLIFVVLRHCTFECIGTDTGDILECTQQQLVHTCIGLYRSCHIILLTIVYYRMC